MAYSRRSYKGAAVSNAVLGSLTATATSITLSSPMSGWTTGSAPFFVVIDPGTTKEEKVCVIYASAEVLTVVDPLTTGGSGWTTPSENGRGVDDTTPKAHDPGATIYPVFTATEANQANELVSKYTVNGDIVVHGSSGPKTIGISGTSNNNKVLVADSAVTDGGVKWAQINADGIATGAVTSDKILNNTVALGDLATALQAFLVPVGTIAMWGGAAAPTGWLLCNGTSTSGYTTLASIVGATTPDMTGKFPLGLTASGTGSTLRGSGGTNNIAEGNLPSHAHSINHDHPSKTSTEESAGHTHGQLVGLIAYADGGNQAVVTSPVGGSSGVDPVYSTGSNSAGHTHNVDLDAFTGNSGTTGSGTAYFQPFVAVNYIIKHD